MHGTRFDRSAARDAPRLRRPRLCTVDIGRGLATARLRTVSAAGAFLETNVRPDVGAGVVVTHPDAGALPARVVRHAHDGIAVAFALDAAATSFALVAITAEMTEER